MTDKEKYILEHYLITKNGEIFSNLKTKKEYVKLKTYSDKDGYETVTVVCDSNGKRQPFHIHRLVACCELLSNFLYFCSRNNNPSVIDWFLERNKKPNKGKLYNAIIKYTYEDVTTIERNLNTAIEV